MAETTDDHPPESARELESSSLALAVIWCAEKDRVGEVALVERELQFGRGPAGDDVTAARLELLRQRPGHSEVRAPLDLSSLSRTQFSAGPERGGLRIKNLGRREILFGRGDRESEGLVALGDTFEVEGQIAFVCVERPPVLQRLRAVGTPEPQVFGGPDQTGFVGESPVAWSVRDKLAFIGPRAAHVLVLGESGTGKEVAAQAMHALSKRSGRELVARSAATIPLGLADAELFGNLANYPNPGTPERRGLVGEADGSTFFLDEIGELPEELQARLLRVLDERGEYQRLGEARRRRSDLRLVAATNRPISALKHDVAARFRLRLTLPGLDARREDIPLIVRHLVLRIARADAELAGRFVEGWDGRTGAPRTSAPLIRALVSHNYRTHVRELETLLWQSISTSSGDTLDLTAEVRDALTEAGPAPSSRRTTEVTEEEVRRALERAGGVQDRAWRELGLSNRFVLHRLMKKMGISG